MTALSFPEAETLITALYAAFNRRDIDAVMAHLSPEVAWPNGWEGGAMVGQAAVREYWTRQWAAIDPTVIPQATRTDADGRIDVTVRQVVKDHDGAVLSDDVVHHLYRFEDGVVASMEIRRPT
jgi:ketosteroid isomerase-like protein